MRKFNRNYSLRIETNTPGKFITIKPPFTIQFDIKRNLYAKANSASITIYNLNSNTRNEIRKDRQHYDKVKKIILDAGYGNNLSQILSAEITEAHSVRSGVDITTNISAFDGGFSFNNARTEKSFLSGTSGAIVTKDLVNSLVKTGTSPGHIGNIKGKLLRGNTYSGNTCAILSEITGGAFFIDNGKAHVLSNSEYFEGTTRSINSDSGLLGTPRRQESFLVFDMMFEPSLLIGQRLEITSSTVKEFDGIYKVGSIHHHGIISEAKAGPLVTSVGVEYNKDFSFVQ